MDHTPRDDDDIHDETADAPADGVIGEISSDEEGEVPPPEEERPWASRRRSRMIGCLLALLGALAGAGLAVWLSRGVLVGEHPPANEPAVAPSPAAEGGLTANRLVFSPTPERPNETPEIISSETEVIWAFYDLSRLPADAPLAATWSREGEPLGDLPLADKQQDPAADHARGSFAIHPPKPAPAETPSNEAPARPTVGFPPGIYQVELTSPDFPDIAAQASFVALPRAAQILQGGGEPEGPPVIRSLRTATGVDDAGELIGVSTSFPANVGRIMAVFTYAGIVPGSVLTVRWYYGDNELVRARTEIAINAAEGRGEAWLQTGEADLLPTGEYRVSVHFGDEDEALATTSFSVTPAN